METVTLTIKNQPELYLEADTISPDTFAGKKTEEIVDLPVYIGKEPHRLGDFFEVAGRTGATPAETKIVVNGDLSRVKYIGMKMTDGEVVVNGDADMYVGAWMQGGKITVNGNVDAFAGTGMKGGEIVIKGNAGNYLGAAYRGDWRGMQGGKITVMGNAGSDIGTFMNGGEIVVGGDVDVHVATHAEGGRIVVKGNAKSRLGGQMVEGEIYVFGSIDRMMPGFAYREDVDLEVDGTKGRFALYEGDLGERHRKRKGQTIYGKLYQQIQA
ncbi:MULTISPECIES: formylmethanofuran dehydrogenase subunit C [unclassified Methanoculleus]|jgi:formylmethanofuran dehydrogenase subunit C|uniref:formylmethanofuran dehydrogenase n=1 Tax=Methanoculleus palmolei TaxID=72612 RepID=A0ABD8A6Z8_9EURY|nr:formylmethanofuran dehydrogenase subunit C [Methanoculleus sp. UBA377]MDD2474001.1 formylmethanofuran dehydrogenase subunit C [Methanoculleus sp.]WOX55317.1 formylmethanofuran dehydrogenase subunit C [Methanoculleus palmolei]